MPLHLAVSPSPQASRALMSFSLGFGRGLMSKRGTPAPEDLAGQGGLVETKGSRGCLGAVGGDVPGGNAGDSWSRCSRPKGLTSRIAWNLSLSWKPCGRPPPSAAPGTQTRDGGAPGGQGRTGLPGTEHAHRSPELCGAARPR